MFGQSGGHPGGHPDEMKAIMEQMKMIMGRIEDNLISINDRITVLEERVDQISKETKKMDEHVDFVSNIYHQVKVPFHYMLECVESWTGRGQLKSDSQPPLQITYVDPLNANAEK